MDDDTRKATSRRLSKLQPILAQICEISGTAGASVGVVHHGRMLHFANHGRRNVHDSGAPDQYTLWNVHDPGAPDQYTLYGIGSLTKAFVAAGIGRLVDEGKLDWTTPIKSIIPEWNNVNPVVKDSTTIVDCLAHRTGFPGNYAMTFQGDGDNLLPKDQLMPLLNSMEPAVPFRSEWRYSSWGYAVAQLVIERLSGRALHDFLRKTIYDQVSMEDTTTQPTWTHARFAASPHAALSDGTPNLLHKHMEFKDTFLEGAAGAYTNVEDMLIITSSQIPIPPPSSAERSYGTGWVRSRLPGVVGVVGDNVSLLPIEQLPELGDESQPMLMIYHQGSTVGYYSSIFLFPETNSAIVVLTNSIALCDAADLIGQAYTQALFDFDNRTDYVALAYTLRTSLLDKYDELSNAIEMQRKPGTCTLPLQAYVGQYWNQLHNFVLGIKLHPTDTDLLRMAFQGSEAQTYDLRHLADDTFEWSLTLDEEAKRGRFHNWEPEYYKIAFLTSDGDVHGLSWADNPRDFPNGHVFHKEAREH